jgi:YbbR domain-containing protein
MSETATRWLLRLVALVIATGIWFVVALQSREQQSEKQIEADITYNVPRGTVLLDPVQKVSIRLRGSASEIRNLNPFAVDVLVNVRGQERGVVEVQLGEDDVLMPRGLELISIEPTTLRLAIDREATRSVPVEPRLVGEPAAGAVVEGLRVRPETVVVTGPESHLVNLEQLFTSPVTLDGHALSFDESAAVVSPDPLIRVVQPTVVTVHIPLRLPGEAHADSEQP